ncbi:MAG: universal stress protein [Rhodobacteraceae bacterium]|nr:universal stress protein [Paracoccaceae bacterium]
MLYKSVLTIWDSKETSGAAFAHAVEMTRESQGHLHVLCPAFMTVVSGVGYPFAVFPETINPEERAAVTQRAEERQKEARDMLAKEGILYTVETAILNRDELPALMNQTARYVDITVLPRPYGPERTETDERITEGALFAEQCPVLIVPENISEMPETRAVIAWDGSEQSLRATKMALPLLVSADAVDVVIVSKDQDAERHEEIAKDIGTFLSRHRINVDIKVVAHTGDRMSEMILDQARELKASLIVMGGYGHSPLREFLFGGATRDMMKESDIPILMAH